MVAPQNQPFETRIRRFDEEGAMEEAADLVRRGMPVAVPTETVYGLAANAADEAAVRRIYEAKGRPSFNPLIVHVLSMEQAVGFGALPNRAARDIAEAWWPGPLTLVVPLSPFAHLASAATAGLGTVALRSPQHRAMRRLLEATGVPLAAPSANASGAISPTSAAHVLASLGGRIPLILDGGPSAHGLESTILKVTGEGVTPLRPGPIDADAVGAYATLRSDAMWSGRIEAPGQLASHYAPAKPLRLDAAGAATDEWLIGFGAVTGDDSLSRSGDLAEAAANLFAALHRADAAAPPRIAVAPIPEDGIGAAINDRLRRAAAPR
jgi:L-threonylcarbamoyladenylate synthase